MKKPIDRVTVLLVSAGSGADPRTVRRELEEPGSTRSLCIRERIQQEYSKLSEKSVQPSLGAAK